MKHLNLLLYVYFLCFISWGMAQVSPSKKSNFALTNATIETVTNGTLQNSHLIISDGIIQAIGNAVEIPENAEIIDCTGLTLYPGFIDAGTQIGFIKCGS